MHPLATGPWRAAPSLGGQRPDAVDVEGLGMSIHRELIKHCHGTAAWGRHCAPGQRGR